MIDFFKNQNKKLITLLSFCVCLILNTTAQFLSHPIIWVSEAEKSSILNKIENISWAGSLYTQLHSRVDDTKNSHISNPAKLMNSMPDIGNSSTRAPHNKKVTLAVESAVSVLPHL